MGNGGLKHLPRMHYRSRQAANGNDLFKDDLVARIEIETEKMLAALIANLFEQWQCIDRRSDDWARA